MRHFVQGPIPRLVAFGLILLGVQNTVCAAHPLFGVRIQLPLAFVVAAGAASTAERGALAGFVLGMMYDLSSGQPLGQTALAYGLGGFVAGYLSVVRPVPRWWMIAGFAALGAVAGEGSVPVLMLVTGQEGWLGLRMVKVLVVVAAGCLALLAPLFTPARWAAGLRRPKWRVMPE